MSDVVTKVVAELKPADDDQAAPNGAFEVILSTPTKDRDGETVGAGEWEQPLPEHITFDVDHGMSVASTVGSGTPRLEADGTLRVSGTYASTELAQQTRSLVNEGHVRTVSVAFLRKSQPVKGGKTRMTRELLNGAFVAVPANPEALVLSSKAGARNSKTDQQHLQAAHDSTIMAGATCAPTKAAPLDAADAPGEDSEDGDPVELAQALDATIDEALNLLENTDIVTLPEEIAQAIALFQGADVISDELLDALGVPDPDASTVQAASASPSKSAAAAPAAAATSDESADAATALGLRARAMRVSAQAHR